MKQLVKNLFNNIFIHMIFILLFSFFSLFIVLDMHLSYTKTDTLLKFKNETFDLTQLDTKNKELAEIRFDSTSKQLENNVLILNNTQKYNYINHILLNNNTKYLDELTQLDKLTKLLNQHAKNYFFNTVDETNIAILKMNLQNSFYELNKFIDFLLINEISNNKSKFPIVLAILFFLFFLIVLYIFLYKIKLNRLYKDILFLSNNYHDNEYKIFYQELDALSLQIKKKHTVQIDESTMIDKLTNLKNYHGMVYTYKNQKELDENAPKSLTILEIDNFSQISKNLPEDLMQTVLQKIAYVLSLYEHPNDIISRTEFNQFTVILSRSTKRDLLHEMEKIQKTIHDLKFSHKGIETFHISISGGFTIKTKSMSLESALTNAKNALVLAQKNGGAKIYQEKDVKMAESI